MTVFRLPLPRIASSPIVRGLIAFGSAEAATRIVRLGTLLIVARKVTPEILGTAALTLSLFELVRVLANAGIGQRLIMAEESELPGLCRTAHRLFWMICLAVAALQLIAAAIVYVAFDLSEVAAMLAALSLVYVAMPFGLVQIFLAMRASRMGVVARVVATQNMVDAAMTVVLVIIWPTAWAIILPKVIAAPVWSLLARRSAEWRNDASIPGAHIREFAVFGPSILATEILGAARLNADKLIVGALLGTQALGIYYFAFNAGLGITQSFVAACKTVVFPHLANLRAADTLKEFRRAFGTGLAMLAPIVAAQALLAPIYVPIIFGATWVPATPFVILLSFAAIPLYAGALVGAACHVAGRPQAETTLTAWATVSTLLGLSLGAQISLTWACLGYSLGLAIIFLPAAYARLTSGLRPSSLKSEGFPS